MKEKKEIKKGKEDLWKKRQDYLDSLPDNELNPNWKEDSEKVLKVASQHVKPKGKKK